MNSSSEKATVCISIDFCHQLRKTSGRIKWAILVPFHIGPLPEKPPEVFAPDEFELGKGCPCFFRWIVPSRPDFKYDYVLILNPIFTSQFISDMLRRSFLTKRPDQLFYLVDLYFGKCHFLFPWFITLLSFHKAHNAGIRKCLCSHIIEHIALTCVSSYESKFVTGYL